MSRERERAYKHLEGKSPKNTDITPVAIKFGVRSILVRFFAGFWRESQLCYNYFTWFWASMSRRRGAHTDFLKVLVADLLQWPVDACWCSPKARIHHELQAVGDSLSWAGHRRCDAMVMAAAISSSGHCRVCRVGPGQCCFCLSAMDVCLMLVPATTNICNICRYAFVWKWCTVWHCITSKYL